MAPRTCRSPSSYRQDHLTFHPLPLQKTMSSQHSSPSSQEVVSSLFGQNRQIETDIRRKKSLDNIMQREGRRKIFEFDFDEFELDRESDSRKS